MNPPLLIGPEAAPRVVKRVFGYCPQCRGVMGGTVFDGRPLDQSNAVCRCGWTGHSGNLLEVRTLPGKSIIVATETWPPPQA